MIPVTQLYYRLPTAVFKARHLDLRSQVMETFVTAQFGQVASVVEVVQLVMAGGTKLQQVLKSTVVAAAFRAGTTLGFGVIGSLVMVQ
jgi:hypothetical protein